MCMRRREWFFRLGLFVLVTVLFGAFAPLGVGLHHDGVMLKPALDVAAGQVIFRDTFNQYGAFTTFFQALAVKLFGGELLVIKHQTVLFYAMSAVMLDIVYARFLSRFFRCIMLLLFLGLAPFYLLLMLPWSSVYALFFMLLTTEFVLLFEEHGRKTDLFIAGIAAAFAFGCRQPCGWVLAIGVPMVLAALWFFERQPGRIFWRNWGIFAGGIMTVIAPFLFYLWVNRAEEDYWIQTFSFVSRFGWERGGSGDIKNIIITFLPYDSTFVVFPLAVAAVGVAALIMLWKHQTADRLQALQLLTVVILAMASYHQYYPVPCERHMYWAAIPMFGVFAYGLQLLWRRPWPKSWRIAILSLFLLYPALAIGYRIDHGVKRLAAPYQTMAITGLRGMKLPPPEAREYLQLQAAFARIPAEYQKLPYLNFTPDAILCVFFPQPTNHHPMFVNWRNDVYPDYLEQTLKFVHEFHPVVIGVPPVLSEYVPTAGFPSGRPRYLLELYTGKF